MSQIQQVKQASDIVEIIGQRVELKRAGAYYKGLCPFHAEKTPSFFVNEMMQRFKCFGCGQGGDVFEFLQQYERMTFYETLEFLAEQAGIKLERELRSRDDEERQQLLALLDLTREYYHFLLTKHRAGENARKYLKNRGTTAESTKLFQLGYALPQWDGLIAYLHRKKKYPLQLLLKAGLVIKGRGGRYYDRFRGRVVFPLRNPRGQVVGFSGRILPSLSDEKAKQEAKYINTPETNLYHKSQLLYGYSELYQHIRQKQEVLVVEGEFDVITSTQAHVNHIVAIKGSALTADHALMLSRTVEKVVLALDTDSAGVAATKRSLQVLRPYDLELRVLMIPEGKDPDDVASTQPKLWRETVGKSQSAYEFLIEASLKQHQATSAAGKRKVIQELAPELWHIESKVERDFYVRRLAKLLTVESAVVAEDIKHYAQKRRLPTPSPSLKESPTTPAVPASRKQQLERYLTFLILRSQPEQALEYLHSLQSLPLELPMLKEMAIHAKELTIMTDFQVLVSKLAGDLQQQLMELSVDEKLASALVSAKLTDQWQRTLAEFRREATKSRRKQLSDKIAQLEAIENKTAKQEQELADLLAKVTLAA